MRNLFNLIIKTFLVIMMLCSICYAGYNAKPADKSWQTISTFGLEMSTPTGIGTDDKGALYETGTHWVILPTYQDSYWITQKSIDKGRTWTIIDNFTTHLGRNVWPKAFVADHNGNLFVVGEAQIDETIPNDFYKSQWVVRKSEDGGKSWTIVDTLPAYSSALGIAVDMNDNLYVTGYKVEPGKSKYDLSAGVIRKSSDGGKTWMTFKDTSSYIDAIGYSIQYTAIDIDSQGDIYVAEKGNSDWKVLKNKKINEKTNHWDIVDYFHYYEKINSSMEIRAIKIAKNGDIYVAGIAGKINQPALGAHWIVRKSSDEGKTWCLVDDFVMTPGAYHTPYTIGIDDSTGNIYIAGTIWNPNSTTNSEIGILRVSMDGGLTWSTQDSISDSYLIGFAADRSGDLYTTGFNFHNEDEWFTRQYI